MSKELRVKFEEIEDPVLIRRILEKKFKEKGLDLHKDEVVELIDDKDKGERVLKVKNTKYFHSR